MKNPENFKYTKEHEWISADGSVGIVGITDFAQHALTDVVFVELPQKGKNLIQLKTAAVIESVKSVSDVYSPVSGEVIEVNEKLLSNPELINKDPYGTGWIFKIRFENKD